MQPGVAGRLELELVPGYWKDLARWKRLGGMLVALLKVARLECACLFNSE